MIYDIYVYLLGDNRINIIGKDFCDERVYF
jgi:hypothetical protein